MTPKEWIKRNHLSNARVARALGVSGSLVNSVVHGHAPTLRKAYLFHELSGGEVGLGDMVGRGARGEIRRRARAARRELGL